jgi:hypothetical protein
VLPEEPTRNEARFLEQFQVERIDASLPEFVEALEGMLPGTAVRMAG